MHNISIEITIDFYWWCHSPICPSTMYCPGDITLRELEHGKCCNYYPVCVCVVGPNIVSRGQTLFRTKGKGLGHGHRATCRPAPWSAYQSQHSIQSHDTWSMWLTGKFKISVWIAIRYRAWTWSVRSAHWARSVLRHQLEHSRIEIVGVERSKVLLCHHLHDCHVTSWLDLHD